MASFMTRSSGYVELAKVVHSTCASITTIFLFTRLWARSTQHKGLWWDDYLLSAAWLFLVSGNGLAAATPAYGFKVVDGTRLGWVLHFSSCSCLYAATGLAKVAFATTMLRLSSGRIKVVLWSMIVLVGVFSAASVVVTWIDICDIEPGVPSFPQRCLPLATVLWIHFPNAIITVFADFILAYLPWKVVSQVYLPRTEKWAVTGSMSLVGLAGIVCLARLAVSAKAQDLTSIHGQVDYTYGGVVMICLLQAEVSIYIVAQTMPLLRILLLASSSESRIVLSVAEIPPSDKMDEEKQIRQRAAAVRAAREAPREDVEGLRTVQLPTGKIVAATSEEGRAHVASQKTTGEDSVGQVRRSIEISPNPTEKNVVTHPEQDGELEGFQPTTGQAGVAMTTEDPVHVLYKAMGLSKKAWSQSPPESPNAASSGPAQI